MEEETGGGAGRQLRSAETKTRILDAAEELFARGGYEGVSVRDIGTKAGVSHALLHHYFGNKDDIYKAVLLRNQDRILKAAAGLDDLDEVLSVVIAEVLDRGRTYATLVTHAALHGMPWDAQVQGHAVRRLIELAGIEVAQGREIEIDDRDHRFVLATVVAMVLGWIALEPWIAQTSGFEGLDRDQVEAGLVAMAKRMLGKQETTS